MKLYSGNSFRVYAEERKTHIVNEINSQTEEYLLNVNIDAYTEFLESNFSIDTPKLHFDKVFIDSFERDKPISARHEFTLPHLVKTIKEQVVIYHLPFTGLIALLQLQPNPFTHVDIEVEIDFKQRCILIEMINSHSNPERMKREFDSQIKKITENYLGIQHSCDAFNN